LPRETPGKHVATVFFVIHDEQLSQWRTQRFDPLCSFRLRRAVLETDWFAQALGKVDAIEFQIREFG
jgi:hypothetical protein